MNRERLLLHSGTPFFRQRVAIPPFSHLLILQLMRHLFTLLLLFLSLSPVAAQDSLAIKQLRLESAKLLSRMTALEARQAHEGDDQSNSQQMIYKQNRARTMAVLSTFEAIKSCNSILQQSLVNAENQRVVADISNPQSGALGFRLDEVLLQKLSAQVSANSDIKKDNKAALLSGVSTLIGTVSQLLNPTSLVVQAVQTIANLIPNQVKDAAKDPTGKVLANQLVNSMKPYLDYYSELQKESENYGTALANMKIKYSSLTYDLRDLATEAATHRVLPNRSINETLEDLLPLPASPTFNYTRANQNPDVQYLNDISTEVYMLTKQVLEFHRQYDATIRSHMQVTRNLLDVAKTKFPGNDRAIEDTKSRIDLTSGTDLTGFGPLLNTINTNLSGLRTYRAVAVATPLVPAPRAQGNPKQ